MRLNASSLWIQTDRSRQTHNSDWPKDKWTDRGLFTLNAFSWSWGLENLRMVLRLMLLMLDDFCRLLKSVCSSTWNNTRTNWPRKHQNYPPKRTRCTAKVQSQDIGITLPSVNFILKKFVLSGVLRGSSGSPLHHILLPTVTKFNPTSIRKEASPSELEH